MIVYEKDTGKIINRLDVGQDIETRYFHHSQEFRDNLAGLELEKYPIDLENYKVINNELVKMTDLEIQEIREYGKILTDEERQLEKLKPSQDEVKKAEQTIEILTLIQEVI